jgi:hypothetical protein
MIFSHSASCLLILVIVSLDCRSFLILYNSVSLYLLLLLRQLNSNYFLCLHLLLFFLFSCGSVKDSDVTIRSLMHFEFIFIGWETVYINCTRGIHHGISTYHMLCFEQLNASSVKEDGGEWISKKVMFMYAGG